jgi:hypothetical protein
MVNTSSRRAHSFIICLMKPPGSAATPEDGQAGRGWASTRLCLGLIAGWALLGTATCAVTFIISTIPAQVGFGRTIPLPLDIIEAALALGMLPLCTVGPVGLLVTGCAYLRHSAHQGARWVTVWTAVAAASLAIEALFWSRLIHMLGTRYANLPHPSWHALDFAVGYLVVGAAMACVVIGARRSLGRSRAA